MHVLKIYKTKDQRDAEIGNALQEAQKPVQVVLKSKHYATLLFSHVVPGEKYAVLCPTQNDCSVIEKGLSERGVAVSNLCKYTFRTENVVVGTSESVSKNTEGRNVVVLDPLVYEKMGETLSLDVSNVVYYASRPFNDVPVFPLSVLSESERVVREYKCIYSSLVELYTETNTCMQIVLPEKEAFILHIVFSAFRIKHLYLDDLVGLEEYQEVPERVYISSEKNCVQPKGVKTYAAKKDFISKSISDSFLYERVYELEENKNATSVYGYRIEDVVKRINKQFLKEYASVVKKACEEKDASACTSAFKKFKKKFPKLKFR